jgi:cytochrome c oxidase subunit 3/cytochrome o ubiquinol oxidase subunit 3
MITADRLSLPSTPAEWTLPSSRKLAIASLIVIETAMFTIFVVAYVFYIGKSLVGPFPSEVLDTPIVSTICLLASSLTIMMAERAFKRESVGGFRLWWSTTILLAAIFLGSTAAEWKRLIVEHHLTISTNLFGTTFYSLVGLHASHVIVGLTLLTLVLVFSLKNKIRQADGERIEMISWYWHFVDAVWVVVFTVVYVVGR